MPSKGHKKRKYIDKGTGDRDFSLCSDSWFSCEDSAYHKAALELLDVPADMRI